MPAFMQLDLLAKLGLLLSVLIHYAHGLGIKFITPAGGATWPAGPITVSWEDAGGNPNMGNLTTYTLQLMVGGNLAENSQAIQSIGSPGGQVSSKSVQDVIKAELAQSIQNGFYLMMTSNTTGGSQVINYSDRFTLIDMNGTTPASILSGANSQAGSVSNVPEAQYNIISQPTASSSTTSSTSSPTTSSTSTSSSTSTPQPDSSPDNGTTLTGGTLAGLITGAILAVIGIVSLIIWGFLFGRRIRRKRAERNLTNDDNTSELGKPAFLGGKAELPAHSASSSQSTLPRELETPVERYEMHGFDKPAEVPSEMMFELEGDHGFVEAGSGRKSKAYDPTA